MTTLQEARGFGVLCDPHGVIRRFVRDDLDLAVRRSVTHFKDLLDDGSRAKAQAFLDAVRSAGAAFDWELDVTVAGTPRSMRFVGASTEDGCLILGVWHQATIWTHLGGEALVDDDAPMSKGREPDQPVLETRTVAVPDLLTDLSRLNNELLNAQRDLHKKNDDLGRLNEEKNRAIGVVAHDLRDPITLFNLYTTYLLDVAAARLDGEEREILDTMRSAAQSMGRLVNDVLDVAALESGKLQLHTAEIPIHDFFEEIVRRRRPLARERDVDVDLELPPGPGPSLRGDAAKLEQVFNNLIDNAVKFSPPGAAVGISVSIDAPCVRVRVSDSGPGLSPDVVDSLFQPFAAGDSVRASNPSGTGLGLAIARRIVEAHGGTIETLTTAGPGATFEVTLPR